MRHVRYLPSCCYDKAITVLQFSALSYFKTSHPIFFKNFISCLCIQLQSPLGSPCILLTPRLRPTRHRQPVALLWCAIFKPHLLLSQLWLTSRPPNMAALPPGIRLLVSFDRNQW